MVVYPLDKLMEDAGMTREDTRRENARRLADMKGGKTEFARFIDMEPSQVSQIIGPNPTKNIGNSIARRIERAFGMAEGSLDVPAPGVGPVSAQIIDIEHRINEVRAAATLAGDADYKPVTPTEDDGAEITIPLVELRLSAGVTGFEVAQDSESQIGHVKLDQQFISSNRFDASKLYALRVRGDSMEPKLSDGDTVIINTAEIRPVDGMVFAINYEGEAVIKRMMRDAGDWWLTSDNADQRKYHRKVCRGPGCIIVGRAVRAITSL